jgi:hypothetical protein
LSYRSADADLRRFTRFAKPPAADFGPLFARLSALAFDGIKIVAEIAPAFRAMVKTIELASKARDKNSFSTPKNSISLQK